MQLPAGPRAVAFLRRPAPAEKLPLALAVRAQDGSEKVQTPESVALISSAPPQQNE
ncbi:hypothetical protein SBV1_2130015 [Verrucomicrobia bacterium]|nr:hypothetical protein SBV1_2130015 [Verrucomicrobiota bacterium]